MILVKKEDYMWMNFAYWTCVKWYENVVYLTRENSVDTILEFSFKGTISTRNHSVYGVDMWYWNDSAVGERAAVIQ